MTCGVYIITDIDNKEIYIGQSHNVEMRWKQHKNSPSNTTKDMILHLKNGGNVKFELIRSIDEKKFTEDEIDFLLNYYEEKYYRYYTQEQHWLKCINRQEISKSHAPPTIIFKDTPEDIPQKDIFSAVELYYFYYGDDASLNLFKLFCNEIKEYEKKLAVKSNYISPKKLMEDYRPQWLLNKKLSDKDEIIDKLVSDVDFWKNQYFNNKTIVFKVEDDNEKLRKEILHLKEDNLKLLNQLEKVSTQK